MKLLFTFAFILTSFVSFAQNKGNISGKITDKNTQEPLIGVNILLIGSDTTYTSTDEDGTYNLNIPVGRYSLQTDYSGYTISNLYNLNISSGSGLVIDIELSPEFVELDQVVISMNKSVRTTDMTTPLSTQRLTTDEILVNPGGNFDVSKVIQVLPGVAGGTSPNRNDIIVRGGGPSENVYYLDGIEIPVLNHFQTQGASGGATGILNVSFISDVQLTSSAFDSRYDNALSSTIVIKQRNGNPNKLGGNLRLSGSEFAVTMEGPLGKSTTFLASARRSYLKYLFQVLDLPIRPNYWDFQYKINHQIDKKTELNFIGIGAIDNFKLIAPKNSTPENEYILRSNPLINQWNYTVGGSLKRLVNNGFYTIVLSRNMFYNVANRYENNADAVGNKLFSLNSHEIENKLRFDMNKYLNGWKFSYGASVQYVKYDLSYFNILTQERRDNDNNIIQPEVAINSSSDIDFYKFGLYGHVSKYFFDERLLISGGLRSDINTFTESGLHPMKTLSPRLSMAYVLNNKWNVSASVGSYYKLAPYTVLGYKDNSGEYVNKSVDYIQSTHYTIGTQFIPRNDFRFTVEGFYKVYNQYPVSVENGISMANIGTDFSAIGNEAFTSIGRGRVMGIEAYVQQKLIKNLFYVASATIYKSEFSGADGVFRPSTWDYGFIFSATIGYEMKKNWNIGAKYRFAGGQPYTPFDIERSTSSYLTTGSGVYDFTKLNSERLPFFQQLDVRIDKKFNFKNASLSLFIDFQNVFLYKTPYAPKFTFERNADNTGFLTTDGNPISLDGSNAIPYILNQRSATIVPAIGFILEF